MNESKERGLKENWNKSLRICHQFCEARKAKRREIKTIPIPMHKHPQTRTRITFHKIHIHHIHKHRQACVHSFNVKTFVDKYGN